MLLAVKTNAKMIQDVKSFFFVFCYLCRHLDCNPMILRGAAAVRSISNMATRADCSHSINSSLFGQGGGKGFYWALCHKFVSIYPFYCGYTLLM